MQNAYLHIHTLALPVDGARMVGERNRMRRMTPNYGGKKVGVGGRKVEEEKDEGRQ